MVRASQRTSQRNGRPAEVMSRDSLDKPWHTKRGDIISTQDVYKDVGLLEANSEPIGLNISNVKINKDNMETHVIHVEPKIHNAAKIRAAQEGKSLQQVANEILAKEFFKKQDKILKSGKFIPLKRGDNHGDRT